MKCESGLSGAVDRRLAGGLMVYPAFRHAGPARALVHRLKYHGVRAAADVLARAMARRVPDGAWTLVPVPRVAVRRSMLGIDPGVELAAALGRRLGRPVVGALRAPWWTARHAGRPARARPSPVFRASRSPGGPVLLVDDVLTTGSTLVAAAAALPRSARIAAVTATATVK